MLLGPPHLQFWEDTATPKGFWNSFVFSPFHKENEDVKKDETKAKEQIPPVLTHAAAELMPTNLTGDNRGTSPSHSFCSSSCCLCKKNAFIFHQLLPYQVRTWLVQHNLNRALTAVFALSEKAQGNWIKGEGTLCSSLHYGGSKWGLFSSGLILQPIFEVFKSVFLTWQILCLLPKASISPYSNTAHPVTAAVFIPTLQQLSQCWTLTDTFLAPQMRCTKDNKCRHPPN